MDLQRHVRLTREQCYVTRFTVRMTRSLVQLQRAIAASRRFTLRRLVEAPDTRPRPRGGGTRL